MALGMSRKDFDSLVKSKIKEMKKGSVSSYKENVKTGFVNESKYERFLDIVAQEKKHPGSTRLQPQTQEQHDDFINNLKDKYGDRIAQRNKIDELNRRVTETFKNANTFFGNNDKFVKSGDAIMGASKIGSQAQGILNEISEMKKDSSYKGMDFSGIEESLNSILKGLPEEAKYRGTFRTEEDFNNIKKYAGSSYDEINAAIESLSGGPGKREGLNRPSSDIQAELEWLKTNKSAFMTNEDYKKRVSEIDAEIERLTQEKDSYGSGMSIDNRGNATQSTFESNKARADLSDRISALETEKYMIENKLNYDSLVSNPDFGTNSGYVSDGSLLGYDTGTNYYKYINDPEYKSMADATREANTNNGDWMPQFDRMTDEEKATFNYIYNTQGAEAAQKYIDDYLIYDLDKRQYYTIQEQESKFAEENPVGASAKTFVTNAFQGGGYLQALGQKIYKDITGTDKPINYYTREMAATSGVTSAIRDTVTSNIDSEVGKFLYQTGMSMGDSGVAMLFGGGTNIGTTLIMGSSAAAQAMRDVKEAGGTDDQALTYGALAGFAEGLFERISLGNLKALTAGGKRGAVNAIKDILKQAGVEGSEEVFTTLANTVSEAVVLDDLSTYNRNIQEYMNQGMSREEAEKKASQDWGMGLVTDFMGGFLSGMGFGAGGVAVNRTIVNPKSVGKSVKNVESTDALIDDSLAKFEQGTKEYALAEQMKNDESARTDKNVGNLAMAYNEHLSETGADMEKDNVLSRTNVTDRIMNGALSTLDSRAEYSNAIDDVANEAARIEEEGAIPDAETTSPQSRNIAPESALGTATNTATETNNQATDRISANNKATIKFGLKKVNANIKGVSEIDDEGNIILETEDGQMVKAKDVAFEDDNLNKVYAALQAEVENKNYFDSQQMEAIANSYEGKSDARAYVKGFTTVMAMASKNLTENTSLEVKKLLAVPSRILTNSEFTAAYKLGKQMFNAEKAGWVSEGNEQQAAINKAREKSGNTNDGKFTRNERYAESVKDKTFTETDLDSENYRNKVAELLGLDEEAKNPKVKAEIDKYIKDVKRNIRNNKKFVRELEALSGIFGGLNIEVTDEVLGANGYYSKDSNTLFVSLGASNPLQYVLSHELTHFVQAYSPKLYAELKQNIRDSFAPETYEAMVKKYTDLGLSREAAIDEVTADACDRFFDLESAKMLTEMAKTNRTLVEKIRDFIQKILDFFKNSEGSQFIPSNILIEEQERFQELKAMYDQALADAVRTSNMVTLNGEDVQYSVKGPYNENTKQGKAFVASLNEQERKVHDMIVNTLDAFSGVEKTNVATKFMKVNEWNEKINRNPALKKAAMAVYNGIDETTREAMHFNPDGTFTPTPFELDFKMERSFMQRLVDGLQVESVDNVYEIDGKKITIPVPDKGSKPQAVGDEIIQQSRKNPYELSNREVLAGGYELIVQGEKEQKMLNMYKESIETLDQIEEELAQTRKEIHDATFVEGQVDRKKAAELSLKAKQLEAQLDKWDRKLLSLQASEPLKNVVKRARTNEAKKTAEKFRASLLDYRQRMSAKEVKNRIRKIAKDLKQRILHPTTKKYIPVEMMEAMLNVATMIDLTSDREVSRPNDVLRALQERYEKLKEDEDFINRQGYDETIDDMITSLRNTIGNKAIRELNYTELESTYTILRAIMQTTRNNVYQIASEKAESNEELGVRAIDEIRSTAKGKNKKGYISKVTNVYNSMTLSPIRFFRRISGYAKNSVMEYLANELNKGQRRSNEIRMNGFKMFQEFLSNKNARAEFDAFEGKRKEDWIESGFQDKDGNEIMITRDMRVSICLQAMNEDNMRHMSLGGVKIPDMNLYVKGKYQEAFENGKTIRITPETAARMQKEIDESGSIDKAYEDRVWQFFNVYTKNIINNTSLLLNGFKKANVENYFPINVDTNFLGRGFDPLVQNGTIEGMGVLKDRKKSSKPVMIEGSSRAVLRQLESVAKYGGMAIAVRNFKNVYNTATFNDEGEMDSVMAAVTNTYGNIAQKYIDGILADVQMGRQKADDGATRFFSQMFSKLRGGFAQATLSMNLSVTLKQAASYPTAASVLGWKSLAQALSPQYYGPALNKAVPLDLIAKYTPIMWVRSQGFVDTELGDAVKAKEDWAAKVPGIMGWIQSMDIRTVRRLWLASEFYVQDHNKNIEIGTDEYYREVAKIFDRVVEETQPNYSAMQRPDLLRTPNEAIKMFTMFMTQRLQNFNILYDAVNEYAAVRTGYKNNTGGFTKEDLQNAGVNMRRAITSQIVAAGVISAMTMAVSFILHRLKNYRDDDDKITAESFTWQMIDDMINSISGSFFGGTEIYSFLDNIINGTDYEVVSAPNVQVINDVFSAFTNLANTIGSINEAQVKAAEAGEDYDDSGDAQKLWGAWSDILTFGGEVFGVPVQNFRKLGEGGWRWIQDAINGTFLESDIQRNNSAYYRDMAMAIESGDKNEYARLLKEQTQILVDKSKKTGENANVEANNKIMQGLRDYLIDNHNDEIMRIVDLKESGSSSYESEVQKMISQGWPRAAVVGAVEKSSTIGKDEEEKDVNPYDPSLYSNEDIKNFYSMGNTSALDDVIEYYMDEEDISEEEATDKVYKVVTDEVSKSIKASITSGNTDSAKEYVAELRELGKDDSQIGSSIGSYKVQGDKTWKELYQDAYAASDRDEMNRIKKLLQALGLKHKDGTNYFWDEKFEEWIEEYKKGSK